MNVVVLDGHTLNPGDLRWDELEALGTCTVYDRTPPSLTVPRARDAEIVLTNKTLLDRSVIEALPRLKYIGVLATGTNVVDIETARERNIPVTNVPGYGTESVAQMAFAHLLNLTQHVAHHARTVRDGRWCRSEDFCYWDMPLIELQGRRIGLVGFGRIGQATSRLAKAFGMRVAVHDPAMPADAPSGVDTASTLESLAEASDVLSLHCPLAADNEKMINAGLLARMKPAALLINTSRGGLIDEQDLADALNGGTLAGAGLDVLAQEPPSPDNPLLTARNCFVTPHISWATKAARSRLMETVVSNVKAFLDGQPVNMVNR